MVQAPRAIRVTPFEPLVHQRHLKDGILSPFLLEEYEAWNHRSIVPFCQPNSNHNHNYNDSWKRHYQKAEIAQSDTRMKLLAMAEENRQLKIQVIGHEAAQLRFQNGGSSLSGKSRALTWSESPQQHHPADSPNASPKERPHDSGKTATKNNEKGGILLSNSSSKLQYNATIRISKDKPSDDKNDIHTSLSNSCKDQANAAKTSTGQSKHDGHNGGGGQCEKPSVINLKQGRKAKKQPHPGAMMDVNEDSVTVHTSTNLGLCNNDHNKKDSGDEQLQVQGQRKDERKEQHKSYLFAWVNAPNTSNDDNSPKRRRLLFDAESVDPAKDVEATQQAHQFPSQHAKKPLDPALSSPYELPFDDEYFAEIGVTECGNNSMTALDISAITIFSPTPRNQASYLGATSGASGLRSDEPLLEIQNSDFAGSKHSSTVELHAKADHQPFRCEESDAPQPQENNDPTVELQQSGTSEKESVKIANDDADETAFSLFGCDQSISIAAELKGRIKLMPPPMSPAKAGKEDIKSGAASEKTTVDRPQSISLKPKGVTRSRSRKRKEIIQKTHERPSAAKSDNKGYRLHIGVGDSPPFPVLAGFKEPDDMTESTEPSLGRRLRSFLMTKQKEPVETLGQTEDDRPAVEAWNGCNQRNNKVEDEDADPDLFNSRCDAATEKGLPLRKELKPTVANTGEENVGGEENLGALATSLAWNTNVPEKKRANHRRRGTLKTSLKAPALKRGRPARR